MSEKRKPAAAPIVTALCIVLLLSLPPLYILGIGPACWLIDHDYVTAEAVDATYQPLYSLMIDYPWINDRVEAYVRLWG